jgi:hypothetical protein
MHFPVLFAGLRVCVPSLETGQNNGRNFCVVAKGHALLNVSHHFQKRPP